MFELDKLDLAGDEKSGELGKVHDEEDTNFGNAAVAVDDVLVDAFIEDLSNSAAWIIMKRKQINTPHMVYMFCWLSKGRISSFKSKIIMN